MWYSDEELKEQLHAQIDRLENRRVALVADLGELRFEFIQEFKDSFRFLVLLNCLTCLAVTLLVLDSVR